MLVKALKEEARRLNAKEELKYLNEARDILLELNEIEHDLEHMRKWIQSMLCS